MTSLLSSLLLSLAVLAEAAPTFVADNLPGEVNDLNATMNAAALVTSTTYYFHQTPEVNVGADGVQKIATTALPPPGPSTMVEVTLPLLSGSNEEIIRFYSNPALATGLSLSGDMVSSVWVQTTNFNNTTFRVEIFDYNPANGNRNSLGNVEFKLLTTGLNEVESIIAPAATTILPGHRLLVIVYARKPILSSSTVTFYYNSLDRDSHFTVHHLAPPSLTIRKSGPATAIAGQAITYTLTITNSGGLTATTVMISDTLPAGATYVSGGSLVGNVVTWPVTSVGPETAIQRTFTVTATGTITNSNYQVTADGNISASGQQAVVTVVSQPGQPNLTISKDAPAAVGAGELITYTLNVANAGDATATNLVISDTIPDGATYITGGTKIGNVVTWTVISLAAGDDIDVTFAVTASASITNSDYQVVAQPDASDLGQEAVVTIIKPEATYLPVIIKPGPTTLLIVKTTDTGSTEVRVLNAGNNQLLLICNVGNNAPPTSCGDFAAINPYKIVAKTSNCGTLQGTFNDATPGGTVTREIICF